MFVTTNLWENSHGRSFVQNPVEEYTPEKKCQIIFQFITRKTKKELISPGK